jgi:hypothetical protein
MSSSRCGTAWSSVSRCVRREGFQRPIRRCYLLALKSPPRPSPETTQAPAWQRLVGSAAREIFFRAPRPCYLLRVGGTGADLTARAAGRRWRGAAMSVGGLDCNLPSDPIPAPDADGDHGSPAAQSSRLQEGPSLDRVSISRGMETAGEHLVPPEPRSTFQGTIRRGTYRVEPRLRVAPAAPESRSSHTLRALSPSFRPFRPALFRSFWDCPSCL